MRLATMTFTAAMMTAIGLMASVQGALAQGTPAQQTQPTRATPTPPATQTGLVTVVNRIDGTVVIEPIQGAEPNDAAAKAAAAKAAAEKAAAEKQAAAEEAASRQYKINGDLIGDLHAGDKVKFSASETNNARTITKIEAN